MDALRSRLEQLLFIETHSVRTIEHKTFNRLLYRNRSQHRHGLYFHRLDHVRRLLRKVHNHVAWSSLRHAASVNPTRRRGPQKSVPLSISSVTIDDLRSIEVILDSAVNAVIPRAAIKVTVELISREHFLPFAVSIIAALARLFVLESKVLAEMRGVIMEASLLLDLSGDVRNKSMSAGLRGSENDREDVGQAIPAGQIAAPLPTSSGPVSTSGAGSKQSPRLESASRLAEVPAESFVTAKAVPDDSEEGPSLYDIMAEHDPGAAFLAESKTRLSSLLPPMPCDADFAKQAKQFDFGGPRQSPKESKARDPPDNLVAANAQNALVSPHPAAEATKPNETDVIAQKPMTDDTPPTGRGAASLLCKSEESSDSEDLDDIFGALD